MTRAKFEFPTEWSLCPDGNPDEWKQPPTETNTNDDAPATLEERGEPRVLAAGAPASH